MKDEKLVLPYLCSYQLLHLPLALAAEAAEQLLVSLARSGH
jgi:hypothetical protein